MMDFRKAFRHLAALTAAVILTAGCCSADTLTDLADLFRSGMLTPAAVIESVRISKDPSPYAYLFSTKAQAPEEHVFPEDSEILRICVMSSEVTSLQTVVIDLERGVAFGGFDLFLNDMDFCANVHALSAEELQEYSDLMREIAASENPIGSWQAEYICPDEDSTEGYFWEIVFETKDGIFRCIQNGGGAENCRPLEARKLSAFAFQNYLYRRSGQ